MPSCCRPQAVRQVVIGVPGRPLSVWPASTESHSPGDVQVHSGANVVDHSFLRPSAPRADAVPSGDSEGVRENLRTPREVRSSAREVERARATTHKPVAISAPPCTGDGEPRDSSHELQDVLSGVRAKSCHEEAFILRHRHFAGSAHSAIWPNEDLPWPWRRPGARMRDSGHGVELLFDAKLSEGRGMPSRFPSPGGQPVEKIKGEKPSASGGLPRTPKPGECLPLKPGVV